MLARYATSVHIIESQNEAIAISKARTIMPGVIHSAASAAVRLINVYTIE